MAFLYGRAGRLNTKNGGFRPGQEEESDEEKEEADSVATFSVRWAVGAAGGGAHSRGRRSHATRPCVFRS
jgi:hypothetical protein